MLRVVTPLVFLSLCLSCAPAIANENPEQVVRTTTAQILDLINRNLKAYEADPSEFHAIVRKIALPHFDLRSMARRAIRDQNWRDATEVQRDAFVTEFGNLMVRTYGTVLLQYRGQAITFLPSQHDSGSSTVTVRMKVDHLGGRPPSLVHYIFRKETARWRIVEVTIDGISIVTSNSQAYQETIQRHGMDALNDKLRRQNAATREAPMPAGR